MERIFNITAFGAVGDGETDCTAAIQAALDAARDAGGGVIEVPPGRYMTGQLRMKGQCITLKGYAGWGYHSDGNSAFVLNDPNATCLLDITGAFDCFIDGMAFNGNKLGDNVHGIYLDWEKHYRPKRDREDTPTVTNTRVAWCTGDALHFNNVWAYKVNHSMMIFNKGAGIRYMGCDVFVSDCIMNNNEQGGVTGIDLWASGATFTANRIEWNGMGGIRLRCSNCLNITGNYLDRNFGPAIDLGGTEEDAGFATVTITGNTLIRNGAICKGRTAPLEDPDLCCHLRMRRCRNVVVSSNAAVTGRNDYGDGESTPTRAFLLEDCSYCIIKDNALDRGYIVTDIELRGDCSTCLIKDNIGRQA